MKATSLGFVVGFLITFVLVGCISWPKTPAPPAVKENAPTPPWAWERGPSDKIEYGRWKDLGNYGRQWEDGNLLAAPPLPAGVTPADLPEELRGKLQEIEKSPKKSGSRTAGASLVGRDVARDEVGRWGGVIGWVGNALLIVALIGCAAAFVPFIGRYVSWQSAAMVLGVSLAMKVLQYLILVYAIVAIEVGFWLLVVSSIVMGAALVVPWALAFYRRRVAAVGVALAAQGDIRAGVALMAAGDSKIDADRKNVVQALESNEFVGPSPIPGRDLSTIGEAIIGRLRGVS